MFRDQKKTGGGGMYKGLYSMNHACSAVLGESVNERLGRRKEIERDSLSSLFILLFLNDFSERMNDEIGNIQILELRKKIISQFNLTGMAYYSIIPGFYMKMYRDERNKLLSGIISIPHLQTMLNSSFSQHKKIRIKDMYILLKEDVNNSRLLSFHSDLHKSEIKFTALFDPEQKKGLVITEALVREISMFVTVFVMAVCFLEVFALQYRNVTEDEENIKTLFLLGFHKLSLMRLYMEETLILLISAGVMGMTVGLIIGWLYVMLMNTLQDLPISVSIPWEIFVSFFVMAVVISFLSGVGVTSLFTSSSSVVKRKK